MFVNINGYINVRRSQFKHNVTLNWNLQNRCYSHAVFGTISPGEWIYSWLLLRINI